MKKIFLAAAAAMMVLAMGSCKNEGNTKTDEQQTATDAATAATPARPSSLAEVGGESVNALIKHLNDKDSTVVVSPTGLVYKMVKEGEGDTPDMSQTVSVKYTGRHLDGTIFDTSDGEPVSFPLSGVVSGFSEGITYMNRGAVGIFLLPSELAYGANGTPGGPIAPYEPLIFEIELVDFN